MSPQASTPPLSPTSSSKLNTTTQAEKPTFIDLWDVPALVNPSPPSNTLLITNLQNPHIFSAASLQNLYNLLNDPVPLNSFAPLPSLRRIIISYPTTEAAVAARQSLEQSSSLSATSNPSTTANNNNTSQPEQQQQQAATSSNNIRPTMKIYFGEPTPLVGQYASNAPDLHLQAPSLGKLMFISPPPSPPCGWEIREEDPPNKTTHAEDLLAALAGLGGNNNNYNNNNKNDAHTTHEYADGNVFGALDNGHGGGDVLMQDLPLQLDGSGETRGRSRITTGRRRGGTLTVYHPKDHGDSEDLPAVMVEDLTWEDGLEGEEEVEDDEEELGGRPLPTRTARPPVELMDVA